MGVGFRVCRVQGRADGLAIWVVTLVIGTACELKEDCVLMDPLSEVHMRICRY